MASSCRHSCWLQGVWGRLQACTQRKVPSRVGFGGGGRMRGGVGSGMGSVGPPFRPASAGEEAGAEPCGDGEQGQLAGPNCSKVPRVQVQLKRQRQPGRRPTAGASIHMPTQPNPHVPNHLLR